MILTTQHGMVIDLTGSSEMTVEELSELVAEWFRRCHIYGDDGQFQVHGPSDQEGMDIGAKLFELVGIDAKRRAIQRGVNPWTGEALPSLEPTP